MAFLSGYRITRTGIVFFVGVLLLIGLVIGAVLIVRDRGEQARRQDAVKVAEQNLENQSGTSKATSTDTESTSTAATTATDSQTQSQTTASTTTATTELPQTGPSIMPLIAVALLALAGSYYVVSRRAVREL